MQLDSKSIHYIKTQKPSQDSSIKENDGSNA
jgi:hypothetical protein